MLFYEPKEDERIGVKRVRMAAEAGANVIVTACPFCMVNIEDAIKVAGLEGKMTAIDLAELVDQQLVRAAARQTTMHRGSSPGRDAELIHLAGWLADGLREFRRVLCRRGFINRSAFVGRLKWRF